MPELILGNEEKPGRRKAREEGHRGKNHKQKRGREFSSVFFFSVPCHKACWILVP